MLSQTSKNFQGVAPPRVSPHRGCLHVVVVVGLACLYDPEALPVEILMPERFRGEARQRGTQGGAALAESTLVDQARMRPHPQRCRRTEAALVFSGARRGDEWPWGSRSLALPPVGAGRPQQYVGLPRYEATAGEGRIYALMIVGFNMEKFLKPKHKGKGSSEGEKVPQVLVESVGILSDSDNESLMSTASATSISSSRKLKRPRPGADSGSDSALSEVSVPASKAGTKKETKRGKPATTGKYVGIGLARREAAAAQKAAVAAEKQAEDEQQIAALTRRVAGGRVNRLSESLSAASEGRILRPPLASDERRAPAPSFAAKAAAPRVQHEAQTATATPGVIPPNRKGKKKAKITEKSGNGAPSGVTLTQATRPISSSSTTNEVEWTTVRRGRRKENTRRKAKPTDSAAKKQAVRLRAPRSTAVVLTLQPRAEERGLTYAEVLTRAKANISLSDLGISGIRCKTTTTGARLLEISGATSGPKADALAEKLRASLGQEDVRVSRPTKCADLLISGLDDSVTTDESIVQELSINDIDRLNNVKEVFKYILKNVYLV
ncbi:hypothetical protein B5X24_HaOG203158 [Helicoverpa armigera]|uniref:Uncharacterized protein n=1 Tax=Helicoverpa armigera TaxID=29058 RepID=A0A2W1BR74_HELAM|nr:hypothetical protein B5X24_HaOG203158 [Helicoverpa armigera]